VAVALAVAEAQRIGRADAGEQLARLRLVEEQGDAGGGVEAQVVATPGADAQVAVEIPGVVDLFAPFALDPQPLRLSAARTVLADRLGFLGFAEPGHGDALNRSRAHPRLPGRWGRRAACRRRRTSGVRPSWRSGARPGGLSPWPALPRSSGRALPSPAG